MPLSFTAGFRSLQVGMLKRVTISRAIFHLWDVLLGEQVQQFGCWLKCCFQYRRAHQRISTLPIAVLLGMATAVLLTGALHEDGFADTCDGLGGGWNAEERLRIMKDSRIGTYGALGLVFVVLLKFFVLLQIETRNFALGLDCRPCI